MAETRINPITGKPFNEIKEVEAYRGFTFTTRSSSDGLRVLYPNGEGIMTFADDLTEAKQLVDEHYEKVM